MLTKIGIDINNICNVTNGKDVIEKLKCEWDIILLDIKMPEMDGYSVLQHMKKNNCKIPVVVITAHAIEKDIEKCKKLGCFDVITKPIDYNYLNGIINNL
jgi:CheY-like chemotaxis protein